MKLKNKLIIVCWSLVACTLIILTALYHQQRQYQEILNIKNQTIELLKQRNEKLSLIKGYILEESTLTEDQIIEFDTNRDGEVNSCDFGEIKDEDI